MSGLDWWRDEIREAVAERARAREQYKANALMLFLIIVGGIFYYYWHLSPMLRGTLLIGTPLTIWAFVELCRSWFPGKVLGMQPSELSKRVLSSPNSRVYLSIALITLVVLLLTTSSVYVEYAKGSPSDRYEIQLYQDGDLLIAPQTLTSYEPVAGKTFFATTPWPFRSGQARIVVTKPKYTYDTEAVELSGFFPARVRSSELDEKTYRVFRILPGEKKLSLNQRGDDPNDTHYQLRIELPKEGGEPSVYETPWFYEPVYFGGSKEMIEHFIASEREQGMRTWMLTGHLKKFKFEGIDQEKKDEIIRARKDLLTSHQSICETIHVDDGSAEIVIKIKSGGGDEDRVRRIKVANEPGIQNIFID